MARPHIRPGGLLLADDATWNPAFHEFATSISAPAAAIIRGRRSVENIDYDANPDLQPPFRTDDGWAGNRGLGSGDWFGQCKAGGRVAERFMITVATQAARGGFDDASLPFKLVRKPSLRELIHLIRAADVVHLAGPLFLPIVAALLMRKPLAIEHHGFQTICPNGQLLYEPDRSPCPGHFRAGRHWECLRCNTNAGRLANSRKIAAP